MGDVGANRFCLVLPRLGWWLVDRYVDLAVDTVMEWLVLIIGMGVISLYLLWVLP